LSVASFHFFSLMRTDATDSGLPGMCSLHANSAREALVKMCTLPLLAGDNISAAFVVPTVASSVDIVVHLGIEADGRRRVREIVGVTGRIEGDIIETSELFTLRHGRLQRGEGYPPHEERFATAGLDLAGLLGHVAAGAGRTGSGGVGFGESGHRPNGFGHPSLVRHGHGPGES
jgi:hypothetical protein